MRLQQADLEPFLRPWVRPIRGLQARTVVAIDESTCLFTFIHQRELHFGTRRGSLGPTAGQRRFLHSILYHGGSTIGWRLGRKLVIMRESCILWHFYMTRTLLEVHMRQAICPLKRYHTAFRPSDVNAIVIEIYTSPFFCFS